MITNDENHQSINSRYTQFYYLTSVGLHIHCIHGISSSSHRLYASTRVWLCECACSSKKRDVLLLTPFTNRGRQLAASTVAFMETLPIGYTIGTVRKRDGCMLEWVLHIKQSVEQDG